MARKRTKKNKQVSKSVRTKGERLYCCDSCLYGYYDGCKLMCENREHEVTKYESCDMWKSWWTV